MFDVRFGVDSLFERVAKLIHFDVMVTFAIVGTKFDPTSPHKTYPTMCQLSICLFVSRLVLICQYASFAFHLFRSIRLSYTPKRPHLVSLLAVHLKHINGNSISFTCSTSNPAPNILHPPPSTTSGPSPTSPSTPPSSS